MRHELVPDGMWAVVEPLLPEEPAKPEGGRLRVPDRDALRGIVFVLRSGLPWEMLPREVFGCSGMACRRRLRDWQQGGVWDRLHRVLLERLDRAGELDWTRASLDAASIGAKKGGETTGPNPTDRGRAGTKRHCVTGRHGTPLGLTLTGANRHDSMAMAATLDAVPGVRSGKRGRPRKRPEKLHAPSRDIACRDALPGTGQGLRPPPMPSRMPRPLDHPPHRTPGRRDLRQARPSPLGGQANLRLVRPVPAARHSLPPTRRHPHGPHQNRHRHHLHEPNQTVLLGALSHDCPQNRNPLGQP